MTSDITILAIIVGIKIDKKLHFKSGSNQINFN